MGADARSTPFVRTTVTLREDLYQRLKRSGRGVSETLNEILAKEFRRDHSLFGSAPRVRAKDLRDHEDHP